MDGPLQGGAIEAGEVALDFGQGGGGGGRGAKALAQRFEAMELRPLVPAFATEAIEVGGDGGGLFRQPPHQAGGMTDLALAGAGGGNAPGDGEGFAHIVVEGGLLPGRVGELGQRLGQFFNPLGGTFFRRAPPPFLFVLFKLHHAPLRLSRRKVTGPSLTRATCMSA